MARPGEQLGLQSVAIEKEIDGVEMGVLSDGTSYLTARGLAKLCGLAPSSMIEQLANWKQGKREGRLAQWLIGHGIDNESLGVELPGKHAYPDDICMLILEYYAFEAGRDSTLVQQRYRTLARAGLRLFVYSALGYDPSNAVPPEWRQFHDRLLRVSAPAGYFGVFREAAEFILNALRNGLPVDHETVPDISLGMTWSRYWKEQGLESTFGPAQSWDHHYPDYFPQSASNPQEICVYPIAALGVFRMWLQTVYVPTKYPAYLKRKVKERVLPASVAELLLAEAKAPQLVE